jgi:serine/threonine protein kinase
LLESSLAHGQFRFRVTHHLGEGGLGTVDAIEVTASNGGYPVGTRLARKRLNARFAGNPEVRGRFEREIVLMGSLNHPRIAPLRGESLPGSDERFYLMPLYSQSLRGALQAGGKFGSWKQAALFVASIAEALEHAHGANCIHRDLKPENIMLDANGGPVVIDWGVGQFIHKDSKVLDLTRGGPLGTSYYCSLEQWASGRCDVTGDIYSLGVMLAELVAGARPITPIGAGIQHDVLLPDFGGAIALNGIVKKMTKLFAAQRHQSMVQVVRDLRLAATL